MNLYPFHIATLIGKLLGGTLTSEEQSELDAWRNASPQHECIYQRALNPENQQCLAREKSGFSTQKGWSQFTKKRKENQRSQRWRAALRYAAVLLLPIAVGISIFEITIYPSFNSAASFGDSRFIKVGSSKALLTLENGEVVELSGLRQLELKDQPDIRIVCDSTTVNYTCSPVADQLKEAEAAWHVIDVPQGGEYKLILADGTKIHLNANSRLRYPVSFTGKERIVELTGEGYFEVAKSRTPFFVKTERMDIEVLGTAFNVSAYRDEPQHATLVSGAVSIHAPHTPTSTFSLTPSQQAFLLPGDSCVSIRTVDVTLFTSWVNGRIFFRDEKLGTILNHLSRWYDMEICYADDTVAEMQFGCNVDRYEEITPFLELLRETGRLKIEVDHKRLTFKRIN